eukprot:158751_1
MNTLYYIATLIVLATSASKKKKKKKSKWSSSSSCSSDWNGMVNEDVDADRVYYLGCVEEEWDYCPSGYNLVSGEEIVEGTQAAIWCLGDGGRTIGGKYMKALFREFESSCFTSQKERSDHEKHLGVLGPYIRALTGETIKVYYKNMCSFPSSVHPHGVKYDKTSEGAPYADESTAGDIVSPGDTWIYIWEARDRIAEGLTSQQWMYHSHVDEPRDVLTGLFGPIIITKNGNQTSDTNLKPNDVDREYTTWMVEFYEEQSLLFEDNLEKYLGLSITDEAADMLIHHDDFLESNLMHSINGFVFGNLEHLWMKHGEEVRWYTASLGSEPDGPHSPHWHGNIVQNSGGDFVDTLTLIPGVTQTVTMSVDAEGLWLYHCHVHDHIDAGMYTMYKVAECPT